MDSKTWLLLVDHEFRLLEDCFWLPTSDNVHNLKLKVKELWANNLTRVDPVDLTVWQTMGAMVINKSTFHLEGPADMLRRLNLNVDNKNIKKLGGQEQVADLGLSDGQILIVRLPVPSRSHFHCRWCCSHTGHSRYVRQRFELPVWRPHHVRSEPRIPSYLCSS